MTTANPVVFGGVPTEHGGDEVIVRINALRYKTRGCDGWCFDVRLQEPSCLDQRHPYPETVHWMVMEAGSWATRGGAAPTMLQVGTAGIFGGGFTEVFFHAGGFTTDAISIIHQVQTYNDLAFAKTRGCDNTNCPGHPAAPAENWHLSSSSFWVTLEREGGGLEQQHGHERIGWLASEIGRMRFGDRYFEAGYTEQVVTGNNADVGHSAHVLTFEQPFGVVPFFFGTLASFQGWDATQLRVSEISESGASIFCEEERCSDAEQTHLAEKVGWLAIDESHFGAEPTMIQAEPIVGVAMQTSVGESGMIVGIMADWISVELRGIYRRPVFFAGVPSANGGDHVVVRLQAQRTDCAGSSCYRVKLQEPNCLDGVHGAPEDLSWMAFESGTFNTDEGALFMTGLQAVGGGAVEASAFSPVAYYTPFDDANVVVFTSVQTFNDPHFVKTRQQPSTAQGFSVALEQEASAVSALHVHGQELVGWLAIAGGSGALGGVRYEATTTPSDVYDTAYPVIFMAAFPTAPRLFGSISTWNGHDACALRTDPTSVGGVAMHLEEETCADSEVAHPNPEAISFMALETIAGVDGFMINAQPVTHAELIDAPTSIGEVGETTTTNAQNVDDSWVTVELQGAYFSPIVFGGIPTMAGGQEAVVRFHNIRRAQRGDEGVTNAQIGHWLFDLRVQEPACQDDVHAVETISWMVMDTGVFFSDEDFMIQTGAIAASGGSWKQINYNAGGFPSSSTVSVISHVQTYDDDTFVKTRQMSGDRLGVKVALEQIVSVASHVHGLESIGWMAVESCQGSCHIGGLVFEAGVTPADVFEQDYQIAYHSDFKTVPPLVFGSIATFNGGDACALRMRTDQSSATATTIFVQEESCGTDDMVHPWHEAVSYFSIANSPSLRPLRANVHSLSTQGAKTEFGEAGQVTTTNSQTGDAALNSETGWLTIELQNSYYSPIVIGGVPTHNGGDEAVVRVRNVGKRCTSGCQAADTCNTAPGTAVWCFDLRIQEADCMDDGHLEETVSWMAAESGTFLTDDGTTLQAGSTTTRGGKFKAVKYNAPFAGSEPVVLSQVMSFNDPTFVKARMAPCDDHNDEVAQATTGGVECPEAIGILLDQSNMTCNTDSRDVGAFFGYDTIGTNHIGTIWEFGYRPADYCPVSCQVCDRHSGFMVALEQVGGGSGVNGQAASAGHEHGHETVGYLGVQQDTGHLGGFGFDAFRTGTNVTEATFNIMFRYPFSAAPLFFASIHTYNGHDSSALRQDGPTTGAFARVFIEEETCADGETTHPWAEQVGYVAIQSEGSGKLLGVRPNARFSGMNSPANIGESGRIAVQDVFIKVTLQGAYVNPRVFGGLMMTSDAQGAVVRIRNVRHSTADCADHWCFDIKVQEPGCLDGNHGREIVDWVVVDEGTYYTPSGAMWQVGSIEVAGAGFQTVYFNGEGFPDTAHAVVSQVQSTRDDTAFVKTRQLPGDAYGFSVALEEETHMTRAASSELVGWMAMQVGTGVLSVDSPVRYEAQVTGYSVGHTSLPIKFAYQFAGAPRVLASIASFHNEGSSHLRQGDDATTAAGTSLFIQETQCGGQGNGKVSTEESEQVSYIIIGPDANEAPCVPDLNANGIVRPGWSCAFGPIRSTPVIAGIGINAARQAEIGESGLVTGMTHEWVTVSLGLPFKATPVVFAGVPSNNGPQEAVVRVRDIRYGTGGCTAWCFDIRIQEPSCRDDIHLPEDLSWMAWEAGIFYTDEGKMIQANNLQEAGNAFARVGFEENSFLHDDISVLTQVQSSLDKTCDCPSFSTNAPGTCLCFVKTRQQQADATGFSVRLEEFEDATLAPHTHSEETVGWIAFESSSGHIGLTGFSAGNTQNSVRHESYGVGFDYPFSQQPRFFGSIATFHGGDAAGLRTRSVTTEAAEIFIQEDTCNDPEAQHVAEVVSYLALADSKRPIRGTVVGGCTWEFADYSTTWFDAKAMGTLAAQLQDDDSISMQMPFQNGFPFYGERKTTVKVASNGYMTFGAEHFPYGNTRPIPRGNTPNEVVAPYWADWNPPGNPASGIYTYSENRMFVVQWEAMSHCCSDAANAAPSTFETILLDDGTIKFVYGTIGLANPNAYAKTSIGIENNDGTTGVQVSFNDDSFPRSNSAVVIPPSCAVGNRKAIGENGDLLTINDPNPENAWVTVQLDGTYESPVIFASVPASVGVQEAVARIRHIRHGGGNCTGWCFDIRLQEPSCLDDVHLSENLAWMVFEAGVYYTDEGAMFQVGTVRASGGSFSDVVYHSRFPGHATNGIAAITQVQSFNDDRFVKTRQQIGDSGGFSAKLEQIGGSHPGEHVGTDHGEEVIGWMSMQSGTGHIGTSAFEAATTDEVITHMHGDLDWSYAFVTPPRVFANIASFNGGDSCALRMSGDPTKRKAVIYVQEETCSDAENIHIAEAVSYIAMTPGNAGRESNGRLYAGVQWQSNQMGSDEQTVGEEGYITSLSEVGDRAWITVELSGDYQTAPVILAGLPTHHNEQEVAVRIKDIRLGDGATGCVTGKWCFDIRLQEPACYADRHDEEQVSWMAMSAGTFYTDEGKMLQTGTQTVGYTGTASAANAAQNMGGNASRRGGFTSMHYRGTADQQQDFSAKDLVILTQIQSNNDPGFVKTRQLPETCEIDQCIGNIDPTMTTGCHVDYSWIEIAENGVGTVVADEQWMGSDHAMDDGWFDIDLYGACAPDQGCIPGAGFKFPWFGIDESILRIGTNGVLTFGTAQFQYGGSEPVPCAGQNACPGGSGIGVDGAIAVLWSDIDLSNAASIADSPTSAKVFWQITPARAVIQYNKVAYFCSPPSAACEGTYYMSGGTLILNTFEAILNADGSFQLQYKDMVPEMAGGPHVSWSTPSIGFEDQTGSEGQQMMWDAVPDHQTAFTVSAGCHSSGFRVALEGTSNLLGDVHNPEEVGWLAIEASIGHIGGKAYEAMLTPNSVTHASFDLTFASPFHTIPRFFGNMQTYAGTDPTALRLSPGRFPVTTSGASFFCEEEGCSDAETRHVAETVGYLALAGGGAEIRAVSSFHVSQATAVDVGEMGDILPNHNWVMVELAGLQYSQPVVFVGTPTQSGNQEAVMRIRNVQYGGTFPDGTVCPVHTWCFQVRIQEPSCRDQIHDFEHVNWFVFEAGEFKTDEGKMLQAGRMAIAGGGFRDFEYHNQGFPTTPTTFTHVQTDNDHYCVDDATHHTGGDGSCFVKTRQQPGDAFGFSAGLESEVELGSVADGRVAHGTEVVGWFAIEISTGEFGGVGYEAGMTPVEVTHEAYTISFSYAFQAAPKFFGGVATRNGGDPCALRQVCETGAQGDALCRPTRTGVTVQIEEETCSDAEVDHPNPEAVAWFALEGRGGTISATPTRLVQGAQPVIGETAPLQVSSEWQQIELINWYEDPVVIIGPPTSREADEVVVRVRGLQHGSRDGIDCVGWCFQLKLQEPACGDATSDGTHRTEGVSYLVIEKGSYLTDEQALFQIGTIDHDGTGGTTANQHYTDVTYPQTFPPTGTMPVLFSQVMTNNDENFVKSRQRRATDVNQGGNANRIAEAYEKFQVKLESSRGGSVHGTETVGWLAIQESRESHMGTKLFEALSTPLVNAAGMECSGAAADCLGVRHDPYEIVWQSSFGFRPQVFASIATFNGHDPSALRMQGNPNRAHARVFVEEDTCDQADQAHPWAESVAYLAMSEHGVVQATTLTPPSCERAWDAATAELHGAAVDHLHAGHYGQGFVDFIHSNDDSITWTVTPCAPGMYNLIFGYGLAGGDRPLQVSVNGVVVEPSQSFPATGAWTAWGETTKSGVQMRAGSNTVTITAIGHSGANVDYLAIIGERPAGEVAMGESGSVSVHQDWQTVELVGTYTNPVVIAGVPTEHGGQESVVRIKDIQDRDPAAAGNGAVSAATCLGWCFKIRIAESACYNDLHATELVPWMVMEAGTYLTDEGVQLMAGVQPGISSLAQQVAFPRDFVSGQTAGRPGARTKAVVATSLQTTNTQGFVTARQASGGNHNFTVKIMPAVTVGAATETVGWVATLPSVGHIGGHAFQAAMAPERPGADGWHFQLEFESSFFAGPPRIFGAISSNIDNTITQAQALRLHSEPSSMGADIFVEDDLCDNQVATSMRETVSFFALQGGGQARLRAVRQL